MALQFEETIKPAPANQKVLIKVYAASINAKDWRSFTMPSLLLRLLDGGWSKPKDTTAGTDVAGGVEAVGENVTHVKPGDSIDGARSYAFSEYVCAKNIVIPKPVNITFEQAGSVATAAITALQALRDQGKLQARQKVLINGASGGVGSIAIQIAKAFCAEVTAVCSTQNVEHARALGANHIIDYTKEDFTRNGQQYDLLFNVNGGRSWSEYKRVLKPNATFVLVGGPRTPLIGPLSLLIKMRLAMLGASQKFAFFVAQFNREDMQVLKEMLESGKVKPSVDKTYPFAQVAEAMRYIGAGHVRGKIVVTVQ